ncbi:MAG: alpha/beta hydrolase [Bacteroidetes bacterium]|nr:alpha/beta hydrolase [Bacteroidota bacterium]
MNKILSVFSFIVLILIVLYFALNRKDISVEVAKEVLTNSESEFITLEGMEVHYRREGSGFPIVLIHGTSAILQTWNKWTEELIKNGYEVIRMDLPAFGLTGSNPDHDYSIPYYVSFIESFTNALGIDSFHLAGNSLGGLIAWEYAVDHQKNLGKLILVDPAGFKSQNDKKNIFDKLQQYQFITKPLMTVGTGYLVKQGMKQSYYSDEKITDEYYQYYTTATLRDGNRKAFLDRMNVQDEPRIERLKHIQTPTLILWGEHDELIPLMYADSFKAAIPKSKLVVFPDAGHIPMEEIPQQSVQDVIQFLKEE